MTSMIIFTVGAIGVVYGVYQGTEKGETLTGGLYFVIGGLLIFIGLGLV